MTDYRFLDNIPDDHIILAERVLEDIREEEMTDPGKVMIALAISNTHASIANAQLNRELVKVLGKIEASLSLIERHQHRRPG